MRGRRGSTGRGSARMRRTPARAGTTSSRVGTCRGSPEDPRSCGDDDTSANGNGRLLGGPPLVRGRPGQAAVAALARGRTPARAGTTDRTGLRRSTSGEDPRSCGDDLYMAATGFPAYGGPPLVRGRRGGGRALPRRSRRTPARAGTTTQSGTAVRSPSEDPRSCGDDAGPWVPRIRYRGGPPLVRGRRWRWTGAARRPGRTPARAGTTATCSPPTTTRPEDPRSCGDDAIREHPGEWFRGGPPLVRGRRLLRRRGRRRRGRTPARAGTTCPTRSSRPPTPEDPRSCGDDARAVRALRSRIGGPPLVRGRHLARRRRVDGERRTPARAGTTPCRRRPGTNRREDPRSCGDDRLASRGLASRRGGPPLVRGRRSHDQLPGQSGRRTPARAGTTPSTAFTWMPASEDPRSCGDDIHNRPTVTIRPGGPPLVRGRHEERRRRGRVHRRTPARAGTTVCTATPRR